MRSLRHLAGCLLMGVLLGSVLYAGQATVEGNTLHSAGFPEGTITFDDGLRYLGADEFVLNKRSTVELHLFAEAERDRIKRLYWVQFEGFVPDPEHHRHEYDYSDSQDTTRIGGHTFHEDVWFTNVAEARPRWRTDNKRMYALLEQNGLRMRDEMMGLRLIRLDEDKQRQLLIVYIEDLGDQGKKLGDLGDWKRPSQEWEALAAELRRRALDGMRLDMR